MCNLIVRCNKLWVYEYIFNSMNSGGLKVHCWCRYLLITLHLGLNSFRQGQTGYNNLIVRVSYKRKHNMYNYTLTHKKENITKAHWDQSALVAATKSKAAADAQLAKEANTEAVAEWPYEGGDGGGGGGWSSLLVAAVDEDLRARVAVASAAATCIPAIPARLWVSEWRRRSQLRRNTLPHAKQWYGLMSVWVKRWVFRLDRWLKLRWQTGHLCGDSSMCRILWTASVRDWQKPLPHSRHLNGFSFEWMYLRKQIEGISRWHVGVVSDLMGIRNFLVAQI